MFEYKTVFYGSSIYDAYFTVFLNDYGRDGWELVAIMQVATVRHFLVFKRGIAEKVMPKVP